jgi:ligand-binding SRPBCC domain-containing protein
VTYRLHRELWIPRPVESVFDFFSRAENLGRITPEWLNFQMLTPAEVEMKAGTVLDYRLRVHGIPVRWRTRIVEWDPPYRFVEVQERGPYKLWRHTHRFVRSGDGTTITDDVEYALPFGILGALVNWLQVRRDVKQIFDHRNQQIHWILPGSRG